MGALGSLIWWKCHSGEVDLTPGYIRLISVLRTLTYLPTYLPTYLSTYLPSLLLYSPSIKFDIDVSPLVVNGGGSHQCDHVKWVFMSALCTRSHTEISTLFLYTHDTYVVSLRQLASPGVWKVRIYRHCSICTQSFMIFTPAWWYRDERNVSMFSCWLTREARGRWLRVAWWHCQAFGRVCGAVQCESVLHWCYPIDI